MNPRDIMATNFQNYTGMPVRITNQSKKNPKRNWNDWYDITISALNLQRDPQNPDVILLNAYNSSIVEKHIVSNQSYNAEFYRKIYEYYFHYKKCPLTGSAAKDAILDIIRMIDLENSTNVWRYVENRIYIIRMVDYIVDSSTNFWNDLKNCDQNLVAKLLNFANGNKGDDEGPKSLASKVCRYLSELEYNNKDSYYINDSVVRHVLPYYLSFFGINPKPCHKSKQDFDNLTYDDVACYLDKIKFILKTQHSINLTKTELDHIMWYCYRNGNKL